MAYKEKLFFRVFSTRKQISNFILDIAHLDFCLIRGDERSGSETFADENGNEIVIEPNKTGYTASTKKEASPILRDA